MRRPILFDAPNHGAGRPVLLEQLTFSCSGYTLVGIAFSRTKPRSTRHMGA